MQTKLVPYAVNFHGFLVGDLTLGGPIDLNLHGWMPQDFTPFPETAGSTSSFTEKSAVVSSWSEKSTTPSGWTEK